MSIWQSGTFYLGETWIISGYVRDSNGNIINLTGATVQLRITLGNSVILDLTTPTDGTITAAGGYQFEITPAQQENVITLTTYRYEVRATLTDGTITVQNVGEIIVVPSRFVDFPNLPPPPLPAGYLLLSGGTMTGPLILAEDPKVPMEAVTKEYVDAIAASELNYLPLTGGTLTGPLILAENPQVPMEAVTKEYVDNALILYAPIASPALTGAPTSPTPATADNSTAIATTAYVQAQGYAVAANYLPLAGGTLTGSLNMSAGTYQYAGKTLAYIVPNASGDNVFFGESGNTTLTGSSNVANGISALSALTSGTNNQAYGRSAAKSLTSGQNNISIGYLSLQTETANNYNTAIGVQALNTQNGANNNVGIGALAGYDLTTGGNNVFMGYAAGRGITTGSSNTVVGYNLTGMPAALAGTMVLGAAAVKMSVVAGSNAFHGGSAGNLTLTGTANACMGWLSGTALTTGSNNCALGSSALTAETTGSTSIAIGKNALSVQNGGGSNIAIGGTAGNTITTGSNNTFIGTNAGNTITTGTGNIFINYSAGLLTATTSNCFGWGIGGNIRQDWNLTTANTHTFTGGPVAQNATPAAGATPVFQSAGALSSVTATTNTPALPASRTNGYLLIAFARVMGTTGTTLSCSTSGWTQILNNAGSGRTFMAAYAYVTGSETAPTFTLGTTDISDAQVVMYSGVAATNPIGASGVASGGSATTSMASASITTTRANSKVITAILCGGLSGSITPPGTVTQQTTSVDGGWYDAAQTTAGVASGAQTFTVSPAVGNWGAATIELLIPPMTPAAQQHFGKVLGTARWSVTLTDGTQEAGSNTGSNFAITPYSDAGVALTNALSITRSTGAASFASTVRLSTGFTVANLPATGPIGACAYVTDGAASLAWGATVTGGGSTAYHVWYNGSAWTVVGK